MVARRDLLNSLPQEMRLQIFRQATTKPSQAEDTRVEYRPFDPVAMRDRDYSNSSQMALTVKATIVLVCKAWKSIATEMLYECIRIHHGTHNLLSAFESTRYSNPGVASGTKFEFDYGRWVRRIEISTEIQDFDLFNPTPLLRILQCCPFVQTVVRSCHILRSGGCAFRPVRLLNSPGTKFPSFPSIKRIDWWLTGVAPPRSRNEIDCVAKFLGELVVHCPKLDYLTLSGGATLFSPIFGMDPSGGRSGTFDSLTTLRLEPESSQSIVVTKPTPLLPNLSHFILGGEYTGAKQFLSAYGDQIRVLEFVATRFFSSRLSPVPLDITDILKACPNLRELNTHLSTGNILLVGPISSIPPLKALTSIRIKLDDTTMSLPDFFIFIRKVLGLIPALERIVLCGGTRQAWEENGFPILKEYVSEAAKPSNFLEYQES